jgi:hypothetical protein
MAGSTWLAENDPAGRRIPPRRCRSTAAAPTLAIIKFYELWLMVVPSLLTF